MSTRCEIRIYGKTTEPFIRLYHHHDGYPSGVGKFLMEEVYPKLMSSNADTAEDIAEFLCNHPLDEEFEYTEGVHGDIEYLYTINVLIKTISCSQGHYATIEENWRLVEPYRFLEYRNCDLTGFLPINPRKVYC